MASQRAAGPATTNYDGSGGAEVAEEAIRLSNRRRRPALPEADGALDRMKYEVADELGLRDDIEKRGWGEMTTREVGTIGGHMVRKMVRFAERHMTDSDAEATGDGKTRNGS